MKAITIYQPYASLIAVGAKRYETRSWATNYRGPIATHAGKRPWTESPFNFINAVRGYLHDDSGMIAPIPYGAVVATADLVDCWGIIYVHPPFADKTRRVLLINKDRHLVGNISNDEFLFGDWTPGRYAWELANAQPLPEPVPCRGRQGLWNWQPPGEITPIP